MLPSPTRATAGLALLSVLLTAAAPLNPSEMLPGPWSLNKPAQSDLAMGVNQGCVGCHEDIAAEWQSSLHAQAYTNPEFRRALHEEPLPFCKGCHAPEADPNKADNPALQRLGVSCVSCHVVETGILAVPSSRKTASHPVVRQASFATQAACGKCHQFAFPGESGSMASSLMQSTINEFRVISDDSRGCAVCHMPVTEEGHRSHRFDVSRNAPLLRAALRVTARRLGKHRVEMLLSSKAVAHAFPTGDLFRRLSVQLEALGPEFSQLETHTAYLTREFETTHTLGGVQRRRPVRDTRLPADGQPRALVFEWDNDISQCSIRFRVVYQRVQHPGKVGQADAEVAGEVELATGELAVEGRGP